MRWLAEVDPKKLCLEWWPWVLVSYGWAFIVVSGVFGPDHLWLGVTLSIIVYVFVIVMLVRGYKKVKKESETE